MECPDCLEELGLKESLDRMEQEVEMVPVESKETRAAQELLEPLEVQGKKVYN